jgi:thiamine-monophosphate kinase
MNRFFAPGREFALIERMFSPGHFASDGQGLGDDAFVWSPPGVKHPWVITADASAEGVHYRLDWTPPARALRKALIANLSDVNAMGGRSRNVFFNLGARRDWSPETFDSLGAALRALEVEFGFVVSGGDTLRTAEASFFSFTVLGEVEGRPLLRSACRPGHKVYVSGSLGGSAAGLARLMSHSPSAAGGVESRADDPLVGTHLDPCPPLALGPLLASLAQKSGRDSAAIDVSDGLSSELAHLARQSGCALCIEAESLPAHPSLGPRWADLDPAAREGVLNGGEEYQLLFTGDFSDEDLDQLRIVTKITEIGVVSAGEGVTIVEAGVARPLPSKGYEHGRSDGGR